MSKPITVQLVGRIAIIALVTFAATLAVIHTWHGEDAGVIAPLRREEADALADELAQCRVVTPNETASLENCRRIWADKRRQFFKPTKTPPSLAAPTTPSTAGAEKNQDRLPSNNTVPQQSEAR